MIRRSTGSYPSSHSSGDQVYFGIETSYTDKGLNPSTTYYYRAWSYDSTTGLYSDGYSQDSEATTQSPISPPSVATHDPTMTPDFVTLHGYLESLGDSNTCEVWFVTDTASHDSWEDYDFSAQKETKNTVGEFEYTMPFGYSPSRVYYRAVASNEGGTVQGDEKTYLPPTLSLEPEPLDFGEMLKDKTATKTFKIWNSGEGELSYDLESGTEWITDVSPGSGKSFGEKDEITVTIDTSGLTVGQKTGYILINTPTRYGPYSYPVKVKIVYNIAPPNALLTSSNITFYLLTKNFGQDVLLDKWKTIPDDLGYASYGYYGHEADTSNGIIRSAMKAKYGLTSAVPEWIGCESHLRLTYTVPVTTAPGVGHAADISLAGNCKGEVWMEDIGGSNAIMFFTILEGNSEQYPYHTTGSYGYKQFKKYEVGAFFSQDDWSFNCDFTHSNNKIPTYFKEGQTYSFWISISSNLLLEGIGIKDFGPIVGKGWTDIQFILDSIEIRYHNPPPSPPEGEHYPEITNVEGPNNLIINQIGSYIAYANDEDGDQMQFKWYWGDGTESDWTSSTQSHRYQQPGPYQIRVQVRDESEYKLLSKISTPYEIQVTRPDGSINIISPKDGDSWEVGTTNTISWNQNGEVGKYVYLALSKQSDPSYKFDITPNPISADVGSYSWEIPIDIISDDDYQVILWNDPACDISDIFTIKAGTGPKTPIRPDGPGIGKPGIEYTYRSMTEDPQEDQISYFFDWGDGTNSGWLGPYSSGEVATAKHIWDSNGYYNIKVKAKDTKGLESEWSEPLLVNIQKSRFSSIISILLDRFPLLEKLLTLITKMS